MTPERLAEIRHIVAMQLDHATVNTLEVKELLAEIDRLQAQLELARVSIEELSNSYDVLMGDGLLPDYCKKVIVDTVGLEVNAARQWLKENPA